MRLARSIWTADAGAAHWKAVDRTRARWHQPAAARVARVFARERPKVVAAIRQAGAAGAEAAVATVLAGSRPFWLRTLTGLYADVGDEFAGRTVRALQAKNYGLDPEPLQLKAVEELFGGELVDRWREEVDRYIRTIGGLKIKGIEETTLAKVRTHLLAGVAEGASIDEIATAIDGVYLRQIIPNRSLVIARTEVIAASNAGSQAGARSTGMALIKTWIATPGPRTRAAHASAWGQRRPLEEPYVVMGQQLMFPGDSSRGASAKNVAQCRCTEGYEPDPEAPISTDVPTAAPPATLASLARARLLDIEASYRDELATLKAAADEATRRGEALLATLRDTVDDVKRKELRDAWISDGPARTAAREAYRAGLDRQTAAARAVLFQAEPSTVSMTLPPSVAKNLAWKTKIEEALTAFQRIIGKGTVLDGQAIGVIPRQGRAYAEWGGRRIKIGAQTEVRVIVHELAHILEMRDPTVLDKVLAFYDRRTAGDKLVGLNEAERRFQPTKELRRRYKAIEKTREDKFLDPYMGKDYARKATEVVSMGVEWFYAEPFRLAKDPDYFDFIYDLLRAR